MKLPSVLSFFTGPWGKIAMYAIGALGALGIIWGAYHHFVGGIKDGQKKDDHIAQLEQLQKENQELQKKSKELEEANTELVQKTQQKNAAVETRYKTVDHYITSPEAQKSNRESSTVIKETIRQLRNEDSD